MGHISPLSYVVLLKKRRKKRRLNGQDAAFYAAEKRNAVKSADELCKQRRIFRRFGGGEKNAALYAHVTPLFTAHSVPNDVYHNASQDA